MSSIKRDYDVERVARTCDVSAETVRRWLKTGLTTDDGRVVRLAGRRLGRKWLVTPEAITAFMDDLTASAIGAPSGAVA